MTQSRFLEAPLVRQADGELKKWQFNLTRIIKFSVCYTIALLIWWDWNNFWTINNCNFSVLFTTQNEIIRRSWRQIYSQLLKSGCKTTGLTLAFMNWLCLSRQYWLDVKRKVFYKRFSCESRLNPSWQKTRCLDREH